jgi:5-methylcytosine-specific restriction endonuclease McrA
MSEHCCQVCAAATRSQAVYEKICDCGMIFQGTARRSLCDQCRGDRRRDHYRRKNRSRLGYSKAIAAFPMAKLGARDGWQCWLCSESVDAALKDRHPMMPSYDHVMPTSLGGSDEPENLKLAHLVCNIRRGNKMMGATV